jgi:hypothetical protein
MHLANASGPDPFALDALDAPDARDALDAPAPVAVADPAVVADPLDADEAGLPELPAHPASRTALARVASASGRPRRERAGGRGSTLSGIWSGARVVWACTSVLQKETFRDGFAARHR